jgi:hypothetical protein
MGEHPRAERACRRQDPQAHHRRDDNRVPTLTPRYWDNNIFGFDLRPKQTACHNMTWLRREAHAWQIGP